MPLVFPEMMTKLRQKSIYFHWRKREILEYILILDLDNKSSKIIILVYTAIRQVDILNYEKVT